VLLGVTGLIQRRLLTSDWTGQPLASGHLSHDQVLAAALAKGYCSRLTGSTCDVDPAEAIRVSRRAPGHEQPVGEWNVYGRVGASRCSLCVDVNTRELRVFTLESAYTGGESPRAIPSASSGNGDIGTLSATAVERYARLYLARAGIMLPRRSRLVRVVDGFYRSAYDTAGEERHLLRVCVDPSDGRLLLLENRTSRRSSHNAPGASEPR